MFFAHPRAIKYLKLYCKVLIIDCTYNTNSAKMPLFEVIRINATRRSFCVCFEFLPGEEEEDLIQALEYLKEMLGEDCPPGVILMDKAQAQRNAVQAVFPDWTSLLCLWHANKSITQKCKASFTADKWKVFLGGWHTIVLSPTKDIFFKRVDDFKGK
jgi:hypothetical protein